MSSRDRNIWGLISWQQYKLPQWDRYRVPHNVFLLFMELTPNKLLLVINMKDKWKGDYFVLYLSVAVLPVSRYSIKDYFQTSCNRGTISRQDWYSDREGTHCECLAAVFPTKCRRPSLAGKILNPLCLRKLAGCRRRRVGVYGRTTNDIQIKLLHSVFSPSRPAALNVASTYDTTRWWGFNVRLKTDRKLPV